MMETQEKRHRPSESISIAGEGWRKRIENRKPVKDSETSPTLTPGENSGNALREKANHHLQRHH